MKEIVKNDKYNINEKAVTLIALVITIIIMLILVGVVINLTLGDKGLLNIAKNATNRYKEAEENEQLQLNSLYRELASFNTGGNIKVEELSEIVEKIVDNKLLSKYPVGSVYISESNTNPSEFIGGEWEQIKDRFLLSTGDIYEAGTTGGEASHTLTIAEMPSHAHGYGVSHGSATATSNYFSNIGSGPYYLVGQSNTTSNSGGSQPHNNMPPYMTVYMWKRIN